ncbi:MAG TPA: hypothetical protein VM686_20490 [Polyangiaceae bacterium]|nr:hypothetical protein [Polyangiaceae bacterium]
MKQAVLTALEPLLLTRAGALARSLPSERREQVSRLARAASLREKLARDTREPEAIPAALCLGREALSLSVSALLASRGELEGAALGPAATWKALSALELAAQGEPMERLMTADDPCFADGLDADTQRALQLELEDLLAAVRARYEPRSTRQLTVARALRFTALVALLVTGVLALASLLVRP